MRKFITTALVLTILLTIVITGCTTGEKTEDVIKVATLAGPTGMGLIHLIEKDTENYDSSGYAGVCNFPSE